MPERLLLQDVGPKKPQAYKLDADITEWKFFLNISQHKISIQDFCSFKFGLSCYGSRLVVLVVAL